MPLSTEIERKFLPHLLLMRGAEYFLGAAKEKRHSSYYSYIGTILLSALSIEAIGNSYGEFLIPEWKDFESASPIAKLRLVATRCGVTPDFGKEPWQTARLLIVFRNGIAHAKPKHLKIEKDCTLDDCAQVLGKRLQSNLEKMITEDFATKSCAAVEEIRKMLNKKLVPRELHALACDGHEYHAKIV